MGSTISLRVTAMFYRHKHTRGSCTEQYELTDKEKEIIRTTWARLVDRSDEISVAIFLRIFELVPYVKQFFPFRDEVGDALLKHPYFKGHAMRFFNAVRMTVINLDSWEVILIPSLLKLGQQHANINGFKHDYFELFSVAMSDVFQKYLGRAFTKEARRAWTKISGLITSTVEQGYRKGQEINAGLADEHDARVRQGNDDNGIESRHINIKNTCPLEDHKEDPVITGITNCQGTISDKL